jgi:hypothetical protein
MNKTALHRFIVILVVGYIITVSNLFKAEEKERVEVGVYNEVVHSINYVDGRYDIVFWIWMNSTVRLFNAEEELDISNSLSTEISNVYIDSSKKGHYHYECKIRATILNRFDIRDYPFDNQSIELKLEFGNYSVDEIEIILDKKYSKLKPEKCDGWNTKLEYFKTGYINYGTNFGDVHSDESINYPSIDMKIEITRNSWNLYFKSFLTLFLSFILASVSIMYPNDHSEEKIGLIVGSLFTTVGNKYVTDDILPIQNVLNLSDKLHLLTIFIITLIATFAILEQRLKLRNSLKNDLIAFFFFFTLFFGGMALFTLNSM